MSPIGVTRNLEARDPVELHNTERASAPAVSEPPGILTTASEARSGCARILAPVDLSPGCSARVGFVASLAQGVGGRVTVLHVIEDNPFRIGLREVSAALEGDEGARQSEARLRRFMEHRLWPAVRGGALVRRGNAVAGIVEAAREIEADLVVVGRKRRRGWDRLLSGRRLRRIVREAPCPVLVIPDTFAAIHEPELAGGAAAVGRRVLAPVDGSEDSEAVLRWGAALSKAASGTLVLFHVAGLSREGQEGQGKGGDEFQAQTAEALEQRMWAWAKGIAPWAVRLEALRERGIAAADVLAAMALRERCDAIVVSSHTVGCWRRMLGGCLAEQLAMAGSSAVLCLPARVVKAAESEEEIHGRGRV